MTIPPNDNTVTEARKQAVIDDILRDNVLVTYFALSNDTDVVKQIYQVMLERNEQVANAAQRYNDALLKTDEEARERLLALINAEEGGE